MQRTKDEWMQAVMRALPPEERFSERNRAITARYARWYLDHPAIFKWAGMAAFASRQVGVAIVSAEMLTSPERLGEQNPLVGLHRMASALFMREDLDVIRSGNNSIFNDIAWAHEAYLGGGLQEIEAHAGGGEPTLLLEGFRLIDRGIWGLKSGGNDDENEKLIWHGNVLLLRHEQSVVLQPVFDRLSPGGRILASFGSELDFSGTFPADAHCSASFSAHFGYLETLSGFCSVADAAQRWAWVESRVVPAWMEADRRMMTDPSQRRELVSMAASEPGMLHRISGLTASLLS